MITRRLLLFALMMLVSLLLAVMPATRPAEAPPAKIIPSMDAERTDKPCRCGER